MFVTCVCITVGKFKGNQDTAVIDAKELRELLEMRDHEKVVSSEDLVMSDEDLKALLDRSDLFTKAAQSKQQKCARSKMEKIKNRKLCLVRVQTDHELSIEGRTSQLKFTKSKVAL